MTPRSAERKNSRTGGASGSWSSGERPCRSPARCTAPAAAEAIRGRGGGTRLVMVTEPSMSAMRASRRDISTTTCNRGQRGVGWGLGQQNIFHHLCRSGAASTRIQLRGSSPGGLFPRRALPQEGSSPGGLLPGRAPPQEGSSPGGLFPGRAPPREGSSPGGLFPRRAPPGRAALSLPPQYCSLRTSDRCCK